MTRTLLIDADIVAYRSSAATERHYDWGEGVTSVAHDFDDAKRAAGDMIDELADKLKADRLVICLSDDYQNFRNGVWAGYKKHRVSERPKELYPIKEWLAETYTSKIVPTLEADDVMGIMATNPNTSEERIMVSMDKDMMTIPGKLYRPNYPKLGVIDITPEQAWKFHFYQTLIGDTTDGYTGCPKIGPKSEYVEAVFEAEDELDAWEWVVAGYNSKGLTEKDAIIQARLARILQHGDYRNGQVQLWLPPAPEESVD